MRIFRRRPTRTLAVAPLAGGVVRRRSHACSGLTTGLILAYVQRVCDRSGVEATLAHAGLSGREDELRDESAWFDFDTKIRLWDAAAAVTGDPDIAEHAGEAGLELTVGTRLKQAMRALGSPDFLLANIPRVSNKFNAAHTLELVQRAPCRVRLAYRDVAGVGYHRYDCECTTGLLRMVPPLFGLPPAGVTHPMCALRGDDHCEFEVTWTRNPQALGRAGVSGVVVSAGLIGAGALLGPALTAVGTAVGLGTTIWAGRRRSDLSRRRIQALEVQVRELGEESELRLRTLAQLSCDLRPDTALLRIAHAARTTIGGARFALLVGDAGAMRPEADSGISAESMRRLAGWAEGRRRELLGAPIVLDDLGADVTLAPLAEAEEVPLGSACAVGLVRGDRLLGALIALAPGATVFFPKDVRSLEIYAGHAAIALWNARLVETLELHAAEDALTGVANRRGFDQACAAELDRLVRHGGTVVLVLFDLDHFKEINDTYGHPFGDRMLVAASAVLRSLVRGHDTVARIGGEEFALLLPGATLVEGEEVAERARERLATIELPQGVLSCSAGVAIAGATEGAYGELLAEADRALYEAKRQGRGRTVASAA